MQEKKRRSTRRLLLLAAMMALAVMAFVPASAMAAAPKLITEIDFVPNGVSGSQGLDWFAGQHWDMDMEWNITSEGFPLPHPPWGPSDPTDFSTVMVHSIVFQIDGETPDGSGPLGYQAASNGERFINDWANMGPWPDNLGVSGDYASGIHDVTSWVVETTPTVGVFKGPYTYQFGIDREDPRWSWTNLDDGVWHGKADVSFTARIKDDGGSGVFFDEGTPIAEWDNHNLNGAFLWNDSQIGWPLWFDQWQGEVTGTVEFPTDPLQGGNPTKDNVHLLGEDVLGHEAHSDPGLWWDVKAPHTTAAATPDATDNLSWTNQNVNVMFTAVDGQPSPNSGVDYTEYIKDTGDNSGLPVKPAITTTGTRIAAGTPLLINDDALAGPVVVWFRSVDKAVPANMEDWVAIFIYIDVSGPVLSAMSEAPSVPAWWINHGSSDRQQGPSGTLDAIAASHPQGTEWFRILLFAQDTISGLATPGIEFQMPTWWDFDDGAVYGVWQPYTDFHHGDGFDLYVDRAANSTDGIFPLDYRATDQAGNKTQVNTNVMIDTRAPVTDELVPSVGTEEWINGTVPYVLRAADQNTGAGVAATIYRVDQSTPWLLNVATTVGPTLQTAITLSGGQNTTHTIDFGSVDAALPADYGQPLASDWPGPSFMYGNLEGTSWIWSTKHGFEAFTGYKTHNVKMDVTAPVVMLASPVNPDWQQGPASLNFTGTDVGSGYAFAEWSTDGGATVNKGDVAQIGGNGVITVNYRGVDKVGLRSAWQTTTVSVATTGPKNSAKNASVKKGMKATFNFKVMAVTPQASVNILIRGKLSARTLMMKRYSMVTTNSWESRSFKVNLPKGKYNIRIDSVDLAGNVQTVRGQGTLTVK